MAKLYIDKADIKSKTAWFYVLMVRMNLLADAFVAYIQRRHREGHSKDCRPRCVDVTNA